MREAQAVVIAALGAFRRRRPAELAAPDDQRVVEQAARLQVRQQRRDRPVALLGVVAVVGDVAVIVPRLAVAVVDLHHAHAALDQPAGDQAGVGELAVAVLLARRGRSRVPRSKASCASPCMRKAISSDCDPRFELLVAAALLQVQLVHLLQQVELRALRRAASGSGCRRRG